MYYDDRNYRGGGGGGELLILTAAALTVFLASAAALYVAFRVGRFLGRKWWRIYRRRPFLALGVALPFPFAALVFLYAVLTPLYWQLELYRAPGFWSRAWRQAKTVVREEIEVPTLQVVRSDRIPLIQKPYRAVREVLDGTERAVLRTAVPADIPAWLVRKGAWLVRVYYLVWLGTAVLTILLWSLQEAGWVRWRRLYWLKDDYIDDSIDFYDPTVVTISCSKT